MSNNASELLLWKQPLYQVSLDICSEENYIQKNYKKATRNLLSIFHQVIN